MEFVISIVFLLLYYVRPQDWVSGLEGTNIIQPVIGLWFVSLFLANRRVPISGIFRTPHDWVMLVYFLYIVLVGGGSFLDALSYFSFYFLTVQSLTSWEKLRKYLSFWLLSIVVIATFGVLFVLGVDVTGASDFSV